MIPLPAFAGGQSTEAIATWLTSAPLQMFSGDFLYLAIVFFVLAILAALVGSRGVAGISMEIAGRATDRERPPRPGRRSPDQV